jgi:hypothetical protein
MLITITMAGAYNTKISLRIQPEAPYGLNESTQVELFTGLHHYPSLFLYGLLIIRQKTVLLIPIIGHLSSGMASWPPHPRRPKIPLWAAENISCLASGKKQGPSDANPKRHTIRHNPTTARWSVHHAPWAYVEGIKKALSLKKLSGAAIRDCGLLFHDRKLSGRLIPSLSIPALSV